MTRPKFSSSHHHLLNFIIIWALYCSGCSLSTIEVKNTHSVETKPSLQPRETAYSTPSLGGQLEAKDITKIDFANFTYSATKNLREILSLQTFRTFEGRFSFKGKTDEDRVEISHLGTIYDHVTGKDASLNAIVVFSVYTGGTERPHCIYIYSSSGGRLELLWSFDTGDRAIGGLRNIYGENGNLILETYSFNIERLTDRTTLPFVPACCAKSFIRAEYRWNGSRFQIVKAQSLSNPTGGASVEISFRKN